MQEIVLLVGVVVAMLLGVGLVWKTWARTAGMGLVGKIFARGALILLLVLPVLAIVLSSIAIFEMRDAGAPQIGSDVKPKSAGRPSDEGPPLEPDVLPRYAEPGDDEGEPVGEAEEPGLPGDTDGMGAPMPEPAPEPAPAPTPAPAPAAPRPAPPPSPITPPSLDPSGGAGSGGAGVPEAPPMTSPDDRSDGATRGLGGEEEPDEVVEEEQPAGGSPPPPPPPPAASAEQWDVVPVFYGTDRARVDTPTRIDYGDARGRRLELGQALVTVPKSHTEPQIERPWSFRIPFTGIEIGQSEDPKDHFTMKEISALSEADFLARVGARLSASSRYEKHALVFVHGFNTTFDFAVYRTAQMSYDLKFDGAAFTYSWPSGGGVLNYTYDRESSGQSQPFLKDFLKLVLEKSGAKAVSIVAHSMGNQLVLPVLKDLRAAKPEGVVFHEIILAAPDVDRDNFENIAKEIQGLAKGVTLYASKNDKALAISRNVNGGVARAGDVPAEGPLVLGGVDTIDVTQVSTDSLGLNHSGYAENNDLLADVRVVIQQGIRPPEKRLPSTKVLTSPKGTYWELVPAGP